MPMWKSFPRDFEFSMRKLGVHIRNFLPQNLETICQKMWTKGNLFWKCSDYRAKQGILKIFNFAKFCVDKIPLDHI